ncbi:DNA-binding protein [Actinoplanes sp. NPDC049596]|uniref:DNA-binding protein n=1 Tax=unclassified Actinoplanes TaxID=2626549 RepID=UPI00344A20AB
MARKLPLMGAHEIRMRLDPQLSRQRVYQITSHRNFPEPVAHLEAGKVWHRDDVEAWIKRYRPDLLDKPRS